MKTSTLLFCALCLLTLMFGILPAHAQTAVVAYDTIPAPEGAARIMLFAPQFLLAIGVGVVLALAFQLLLTNLSFAAGLNVSSLGHDAGPSHPTKPHTKRFNEKVEKATNLFGLWAVVTASMALFFASLLAGTLGFLANPGAGAVLGLAIWAVFYLIMVRFEANIATSVLSSVFNVTTSALTGIAGSTRKLLESGSEAAGHVDARAAYDSARHRIDQSDEVSHQKAQARKMAHKLQSSTGLTPDAMREMLYEALHDPSEAMDELLARLQMLDRNRMKGILLEHDQISEEDVNAMLDRYDSVRKDIIENKDQTKAEIERRLEAAKKNAYARAEDARDWMEHMAWWAFGIAVISGASAAIGGTVAALLNMPPY